MSRSAYVVMGNESFLRIMMNIDFFIMSLSFMIVLPKRLIIGLDQ